MSITEELTKELLEELNCDTAFTIPLFGGIAVPESVVVTWIIMALLIVISILISVLLYIAIANLIGLIGFKPPTKDMGVTAGMAILSILLVEFAGIRQKGTKGWLKSFIEPIPIIAPINLLEVVTRPLSLCMRLFGNVLGSYVVMELLKIVVPAVLPAVFSVYFDIFDGLIQAFVFVFLTALYVGEAAETEN